MKHTTRILSYSICFLLFTGAIFMAQADDVSGRPELGRVKWSENFEAASKESAKTGKPIFLLFQEVPGCSTCVNFGAQVLSDPFLVETIESSFIPVLVFNNKAGKSAELLKKFKEPSWNNPVVRFVNAKGEDVIPRKDGVWTLSGITSRAIEVLNKTKQPLPKSVTLGLNHDQQTGKRNTKRAVFAMACFWEGEARLGRLDGVEQTTSAWHDGREVVEVKYDPTKVNLSTLCTTATKLQCASKIYVADADKNSVPADLQERVAPLKGAVSPAKASHRKYYLRKSLYHKLPLSPFQQAKVNAALRFNESPDEHLTEAQLALLKKLRALKSAGKLDKLGVMNCPESATEVKKYNWQLLAKLSAFE